MESTQKTPNFSFHFAVGKRQNEGKLQTKLGAADIDDLMSTRPSSIRIAQNASQPSAPPPSVPKYVPPVPLAGPSTHVITKINERYKDDPVNAALDSLAPYQKEENVIAALGKKTLQELADSRSLREEMKQDLEEDRLYKFIKLVEGASRDRTLSRRNVRMGAARGLVSVDGEFDQPMNVETDELAGESSSGRRSRNRERDEVPIRKVDAVPDPVAREGERLRLMREFDDQLAEPEVSGRIEMQPELQAAVNKALMDLTQLAYQKFMNAKLEHFLANDYAMGLFAHLVATNVIMLKIRNSSTYHYDDDHRKRVGEVRRYQVQIYTDLEWDPMNQCFTPASPKKRDKNMLDIAMQKYRG